MNIRRVVGAYFSPIGTTRRVVTCLARRLADCWQAPVEFMDFTLPARRQEPLLFKKDDFVILGVPVYAGRVPNVLLKYLACVEANGAQAIPVVVFGNRAYDDALLELRDILSRAGALPVAAAAVVGEHSFSRVLGQGRPDARDLMEVEEFAGRVAAGMSSFDISPVNVPGNPNPVYFTPKDANGHPIPFKPIIPRTSDACNACKWCVAHCPMGSISADNPAEIIGPCIKCCACVKGCPQGAKYFDDEGYLHHLRELEKKYAARHPNEFFL